MISKTWKLGEVCQGGVITVEVSNTEVSVIAKEWDTTQGWNMKTSDQSNAKEFNRKTVMPNDYNAYGTLDAFLNELTTSYHSDQIMDWINSKIRLNKNFDW